MRHTQSANGSEINLGSYGYPTRAHGVGLR